jgi:DNA topoisomerase-1
METKLIRLPHEEIVKIERDYERIAKMVRLVYVNDTMPGITRVRKGKGFAYYCNGKKVAQDDRLSRIRKLAIPPAWTNVWICVLENGHIQATGYDLRKRKQYRYHALWSAARSETKYHHLYEFGKVLPAVRARMEKDLALPELCQRKVIAAVISLMERTYIRIGSEDYEKLYGSYGITTLKNSHVKISGTEMKFSFVGKKNITHNISLRSKRLAKIVKQCRDIPGKELFQYYDEQGERHAIDSGMVNEYIREAAEAEFTAKDFRTWAGTLNLLRAFRSLGEGATEAENKKNILLAFDEVSRKLGNTRMICRKYYVHPEIIRLYESNDLKRYFKGPDHTEDQAPDPHTGLMQDERILIRILKSLHKTEAKDTR